jgi:hypothetical protein
MGVFKRLFNKRQQRPQYSAILFSGGRMQAEIIANMEPCFIRKIDADGLYIEVHGSGRVQILRPGDWLVKTRFSSWQVITDPVFCELFMEIA